MTPIRFAVAAMGTRFEIVLSGDARQADLVALGEAAIAEIGDWHRRLSRFAPDSLVSHINRTAAVRPVPLEPATFALFRDALLARSGSQGAFDIAGGRGAVVVDEATRTVWLDGPETRVDLGGIAKGHALDQAGALLRSHGVTSALLHGGTSTVVAIGAPGGADGWRVALGPGPGATTVDLRDEALSVSAASPPGNAGHIVDPRTGRCIEGTHRAAVVGPSARLADAWSTAAAVLGSRPPGCGPEWRVALSGGAPGRPDLSRADLTSGAVHA
jgi:FAD:protein FMN transferase